MFCLPPARFGDQQLTLLSPNPGRTLSCSASIGGATIDVAAITVEAHVARTAANRTSSRTSWRRSRVDTGGSTAFSWCIRAAVWILFHYGGLERGATVLRPALFIVLVT